MSLPRYGRLSVAFVLLAMLSPATAQEAPGEMEQRMACMGDALRLCAQFVPDREKIRLCLAAQRGALSPGCRPVFDASMKALNAHRSP